MSNERYKSTIAFTDLLFNILVGFAFLFIIAFLLIKPEAKKQDFERKAEFVVVMEWDKGAHGDIDLYVQDPTGAQCSFRFPVANFMHLDKDDLGASTDSVVNADGSVSTVRINREVITIRGIIEVEYIINAHYYSSREWTRIGQLNTNVDVAASEKVENKKIDSKCGWSPFNGYKFKGTRVMTIIDGKIKMQDGNIIGDPEGKPINFY